jgi:hypothetical protein
MQPENHELTFRNLLGEQEYPLLLELNLRSRKANHMPEPVTLEDIAQVLANMEKPTQEQGVIFASAGIPIGYSRLGWYSSQPETRLYYQISFMVPEERACWPALIAENERRQGKFAAEPPPVPERYFQAWAADRQADWMAVLGNSGTRL